MSESPDETARSRSALRRWIDPRMLFLLAFTVAAMAYALKGVDFSQVAGAIGHAHLGWLVLPTILANLAALWLRAVRWQHLAAHVVEFDVGVSYRATAIGFMVNNLVPFRVGEIVRPWVLAKEIGTKTSPLLGTVVLERVIDALIILGIAMVVIGRQVDLDFVAILALVPIGLLIWLRLRPGSLLGLAEKVGTAVLPGRIAPKVDQILRELAHGVSGLRGGKNITAVVVYSALVWGVAIPITYLAPIMAVAPELAEVVVEASFAAMSYVGFAVAIPAVPGMFGVYHAGCRAALVPAGASVDVALAIGTLSHGFVWIITTAAGMLALRQSGSRLGDMIDQARNSAGG